MTQNVLVEHPQPGVAFVTFNRPERRNALSIGMMQELVQRMEELAEGRKTRVAIVKGAGPVFCAGLDLAEASNPDLMVPSANGVAATLRTLRYSPLVTIAAVRGGAYAGGAGVVAACDIAIGENTLKIGFPEARRGLLPALISDVLRTKVREGDLAELFLVGNAIDANRAQQIGLLQCVVPSDQLENTAMELANGILAGGPQTIIDTKALLHRAFDSRHPNHGDSHEEHGSIDEHLKARNSDEAREGLRAFLEKRPPSWMVS